MDCWIYYNLCAKAAADFLDRESVQQGAVGDLVQHIHETGKQGVAYGVLCPLFHVIVCVDMNSGRRFEHAPALTFLPPRCGYGPWAQGIDALMKLSFHLQDAAFDLDLDPRGAARPRNTHTPTHFDKFPLEIVQRILADTDFEQYSTSPDWLIALGSRSALAPYVFRPTISARCGMYVGWGDLPGTPIFEVGQAGALSVAASHITLAEFRGLG